MNLNQTIYENLGGEEAVRSLVEAFYPIVVQHPLIGPLFPEDIRPVMEKQFMFLTQFFGGPALYTEHVGPPMMRARHLPFPITDNHADAWLECMGKALHEIGVTDPLHSFILKRLSGPAHHFVNTP